MLLLFLVHHSARLPLSVAEIPVHSHSHSTFHCEKIPPPRSTLLLPFAFPPSFVAALDTTHFLLATLFHQDFASVPLLSLLDILPLLHVVCCLKLETCLSVNSLGTGSTDPERRESFKNKKSYQTSLPLKKKARRMRSITGYNTTIYLPPVSNTADATKAVVPPHPHTGHDGYPTGSERDALTLRILNNAALRGSSLSNSLPSYSGDQPERLALAEPMYRRHAGGQLQGRARLQCRLLSPGLAS